MSRSYFVIHNEVIRRRAIDTITRAPDFSRVEIKDPRRTLPQNNRMWAMLTDVSRQKTHMGQHYAPDDWKHLFAHACGRETRFLPALDGRGVVPIPLSTSDMGVAEMADLIEFMFAWGAQNDVVWSEPEKGAQPAGYADSLGELVR